MKKISLVYLALGLFPFFLSCKTGTTVEFIQHEDRIDVMAGDKLITSYIIRDDLPKPCLYPVHSPSGEVVTRWSPFKEVEGESSDHPHHTGLYFTYGSKNEVNGNDYWANRHRTRTPLPEGQIIPFIKHDRVVSMSGGKDKGSLTSVNLWIDRFSKPLMEEHRVMDFIVRENEYVIDFTINLTPVDTVVSFEDTKEGMFAIRVADWLAENANGTLFKSTGEYLNAEGNRTEKNIWGRRSSWVRLEGNKDGKNIGIVLFHHPQSVNYPTYWHARSYGCFAANPLGQFDFQKGTGIENPQYSSLSLQPGESALFKFRMIVYEGTRNKEQLDREFELFSAK